MSENRRETARVRRRARLRSAVLALVATTVTIFAFLSVTLATGFPGPGPLQRYRYDELDRLVDKINAQPTRVVNMCGTEITHRPTAHVDLLRARVDVTGGITELLLPEENAMLSSPAFMPAVPACK